MFHETCMFATLHFNQKQSALAPIPVTLGAMRFEFDHGWRVFGIGGPGLLPRHRS